MYEQEQRNRFEKYMRKQNACVSLAKHLGGVLDGVYKTITVQRAWILWLAAVGQEI